ncbi:ParB/RepB/Spo0J family partition protein [Embleya sp. NBC_00896]|uniref:ParB/RepB/Spo0J family partition protein n=1 Tax=Embleya sp. NBC_00896 TaxID=2975961 RepID=UPI002F909D9A|nr:ParB/RepB/Spo0J family partition protein [Embleya sp. NBC_00896]
MAGQRTSLASLAGQKVEDVPGRGIPMLVSLDLSRVVPTPLNPRFDFGGPEKLRELGESMRRRQLQPIVVVSRTPYLKLFPEHTDRVGTTTYVIANGERRYRAANLVGLGTIEAVIREGVVGSRRDFLDAVLSENLDRMNFDPVEEARAVEQMVVEFGSARAVAEHRGKHEAWVSQRRSLLRLSPDMQALVSSRQMPVEKARNLAKAIKDRGLDDLGQAEWWEQEQAARALVPRGRKELPAPAHPPATTARAEDLTAVKSSGSPAVRRGADDLPQTSPSSPGRPPTASPAAADSVTPSTAAVRGTENLTAVKPSTPGNTLQLPWDSPEELDRILRENMTPECRTTLAKLLSVAD